MKILQEDVVRAALTVEHWCHDRESCEGCPFGIKGDWGYWCVLTESNRTCMIPEDWDLAEKLRTRGAKKGE